MTKWVPFEDGIYRRKFDGLIVVILWDSRRGAWLVSLHDRQQKFDPLSIDDVLDYYDKVRPIWRNNKVVWTKERKTK